MFHPVEAVHWLQMLLNRPEVGPLDEAAYWSLFEQAGQPLAATPASVQQTTEIDLLVVVTTYQRAQSCAHVLQSLSRAIEQLGERTVRVLVLHDRSRDDYRKTRALAQWLFGAELIWLDAREHLGKAGYWKTYQTSFLAARRLRPRHALYLQDDLQFADDLLVRAEALFEATAADPLRRVIYLFSSQEDEPNGRWIRFARKPAGEGLALTQWFDLQAFFVDRAFFELLDHRMIPVHPNRWRRKRSLSSGVGRQLTLRLRRRANVYQAYPPLVFHGAAPSEMNPSVRSAQPLDNRALQPDARPSGLSSRDPKR